MAKMDRAAAASMVIAYDCGQARVGVDDFEDEKVVAAAVALADECREVVAHPGTQVQASIPDLVLALAVLSTEQIRTEDED